MGKKINEQILFSYLYDFVEIKNYYIIILYIIGTIKKYWNRLKILIYCNFDNEYFKIKTN